MRESKRESVGDCFIVPQTQTFLTARRDGLNFLTKNKMKVEAQRILDLFNGDEESALKCINELIRETGAKYWYDVRREYEQA